MLLTPEQITASHAIADADAERTRAIRQMHYARDMIADAAAALAAGDLDVVEEFLDRVLVHLNAPAPTPTCVPAPSNSLFAVDSTISALTHTSDHTANECDARDMWYTAYDLAVAVGFVKPCDSAVFTPIIY